jgi:hypothetical protein
VTYVTAQPPAEQDALTVSAWRDPVDPVPTTRPRTLFKRLAFLVGTWLVVVPAGAAGSRSGERATVPAPLGWQEPAPLARLFLQLPFEAPEVSPAGTLEGGVRLLYSNSLLSARSETLTLDVQVETAQPTAWLHWGVAPGIEAQLAVPFVIDSGGFLDQPIEAVETWFRATNPQRAGRPRNVAHFQLTRPDGSGIVRDGLRSGLGDAWAGLKVKLADGAWTGGSLAIRAALKVPTGRLPFGSEAVEVGASLLSGWNRTTHSVRLQLDLLVPTARLAVVHIDTHPYGALHLGVTRRLGDHVALHLQASGHASPLTRTGLGQLDRITAYILGGATFAVGSHVSVDVGVSENVFSPYRGADISFLVGVSARSPLPRR